MPLRKDIPAEVPKAPDFLVSLRSHTVWEKTPVKLFCTVSGQPSPIVKWFIFQFYISKPSLSVFGNDLMT